MFFVWQRLIWLRYSLECFKLTRYPCYLLPWSCDPSRKGGSKKKRLRPEEQKRRLCSFAPYGGQRWWHGL